MWAMLTGSFLASRGGICPALIESGFSAEETRRSWAAFCHGRWSLTRLLRSWREQVVSEGQWQAHRYEGYSAVAVDITSFYRPRLQGWLGKAYCGLLGKALRGVAFGMVAEVGSVLGQRLALPKKLLRSKNEQGGEKELKRRTLAWLAEQLKDDEVAVLDAGFKLAELAHAGVEQYVVRQASNCTARRNQLPSYKGRGAKAKYGESVRPLARCRKGNPLKASQPDEVTDFESEGRLIQVHLWHGLVRSDQRVLAAQQTFSLFAFFDPLYQQPLVLAVTLPLRPESVFLLYRDRWAVEQLPLAAKQMLGLKRSFVFNPEAVFRLPELALLTGNILTYLAATLPASPSGFWDKSPKKHPVGFAGL